MGAILIWVFVRSQGCSFFIGFIMGLLLGNITFLMTVFFIGDVLLDFIYFLEGVFYF